MNAIKFRPPGLMAVATRARPAGNQTPEPENLPSHRVRHLGPGFLASAHRPFQRGQGQVSNMPNWVLASPVHASTKQAEKSGEYES